MDFQALDQLVRTQFSALRKQLPAGAVFSSSLGPLAVDEDFYLGVGRGQLVVEPALDLRWNDPTRSVDRLRVVRVSDDCDAMLFEQDRDNWLVARLVPGARDLAYSAFVVDFLATRQPTCPVLIHTTNSLAAPGMELALEDSGWTHRRVVPYNGLQWIRTAWLPEVDDALTQE